MSSSTRLKSTSKWTPYEDEGSGHTYYYNVETKESRWTAPGWILKKAGLWEHEDTGLTRTTDPGWQVFFDPTYQAPYWYHAESGERTWEQPQYALSWSGEEQRGRGAETTSTKAGSSSSAPHSSSTAAASGPSEAARANKVSAVRITGAEAVANGALTEGRRR